MSYFILLWVRSVGTWCVPHQISSPWNHRTSLPVGSFVLAHRTPVVWQTSPFMTHISSCTLSARLVLNPVTGVIVLWVVFHTRKALYKNQLSLLLSSYLHLNIKKEIPHLQRTCLLWVRSVGRCVPHRFPRHETIEREVSRLHTVPQKNETFKTSVLSEVSLKVLGKSVGG